MDIALLLLLFLVATLAIRWIRIKDPEPIFNVYWRPNKWYPIKYAIVYTVLTIRTFYARWGLHNLVGLNRSSISYGIKSSAELIQMEKPQILPHDKPNAVDGIYFEGSSKNGFYFTISFARRQKNIANSIVFFKIPTVGLLLSPKHPDTAVKADPDAYAAEGLRIENVEPMKLWRLEYDGLMKLDGPEDRMLRVNIRLEWSSELPYCSNHLELDRQLLSRAIARQKWSRAYFKNLKQQHEIHYQQMGHVRGTVNIEGHGEHYLDMDGQRDHSYGYNRQWKLVHRYVLHNVFVNDGTKFAVGIISLPISFSEIEYGYLYTPSGKLISIESCDLELFRHGEQGTPPTDYAFSFKAAGKDYYVQCQVLETVEVYLGEEWEARIATRMCKYQINGKSAWGYSNWHYRHHDGKGNKFIKSYVR